MSVEILAGSTLSIADSVGSTTFPDLEGVLGEWWFGGSDAVSRNNRITGVNATLIGTPTYQTGYATFGYDDNSGMTLDVGLPIAGCLLALVRPKSGGALLASPNALDDWNLYLPDGSSGSAGQGGLSGSTDQAVVPIATPANFTLVMGVYMVGAPSRIYRFDAAGVSMDDAGIGFSLPAARNSAPIQLGGRVNGNVRGTADYAAFAVVDGLRGERFGEDVWQLWSAKAASGGAPTN